MKRLIFIVTITVAVLLAACATNQISHYQLSFLNKSMLRDEVLSKFEKAPSASGNVFVNGRRIHFDRYRMNNGVYSDWYFLAFESDRLLYWGYAAEFRRLADPVLSQAIDEGIKVTEPVKP